MSDGERHQPSRLINPLGPRVLVRILDRDERTPSGLYVPQNAAPEGPGVEAMYGEVVAVARADGDSEDHDLTGGVNVSGIPDGARVLLAPDAGFRVPWDTELRIVTSKEVLAVVEEFSPSQAH